MPYLLVIKTNLLTSHNYLDNNKSIAKSLTNKFQYISPINDIDQLTNDSYFQLTIDHINAQGIINLYPDNIDFEIALNQNPQKLFDTIFDIIEHLYGFHFIQEIPDRELCIKEYLDDCGLSDRVIELLR